MVNTTRNILLIGRTGSGKSTLANVLMGEDKFIESAKSISVTKNIEEEVFEIDLKEDGSEKMKYRVIDTIGIGDTKLKPQGVLIKLAEMASRVKKEGLNQILFVTRGRFSKEEIEAYDLLSSIIFDKEVLKYTTIVRAGFPEFEDQEVCDEDRWELREENPKLAHILNSVKVVYLDNPPLKGRNAETNKEIREESRKRLLTYLGTCEGNYRPSNIDTLNERVEEYRTNEQKLKDKMKELEKARKEQEEKFRKEMTELKEQQTKELKEMRDKNEEEIRKVKVEGDENLRRTRNELEEKQKRDREEQDRKNKEEIKGLKDNYEQQAKSIKDDAERQRRAAEERDRQNSERVDNLQKQLNEKSSSSNADLTTALLKIDESNRAREDRAEAQRLDFEKKRLDAETAREDKRQQKEDEREERFRIEKEKLEKK